MHAPGTSALDIGIVGNGANTGWLQLSKAWTGVRFNPLALAAAQRRDHADQNQTRVHKAFVTPFNVVELFEREAVPREPDYVSPIRAIFGSSSC